MTLSGHVGSHERAKHTIGKLYIDLDVILPVSDATKYTNDVRN